MKFLVWNACSFFFLAVNQLQKTGSSVHNQSLREKHAFSVEFLLVYRSVLRWRSNTHVGFLFWLWPNQKEPLSNLKAVIKPTWTKQRSTEISWNFTTVCTLYTRRRVRKTATFVFDSGNSTLTAWQVSDTNTLVSSDQSILDVNGGSFGRWVWVSRLDFQRKYSQNEK